MIEDDNFYDFFLFLNISLLEQSGPLSSESTAQKSAHGLCFGARFGARSAMLSVLFESVAIKRFIVDDIHFKVFLMKLIRVAAKSVIRA